MTKVPVGRVSKHYPSMTARDFWLIADVLRSITAERPSMNVVVERFADELEHTNQTFNRDMFIKACFTSKETSDVRS